MKWLLSSFDALQPYIIYNILFLKANKIEFVPESLDQFFSLSSRITKMGMRTCDGSFGCSWECI